MSDPIESIYSKIKDSILPKRHTFVAEELYHFFKEKEERIKFLQDDADAENRVAQEYHKQVRDQEVELQRLRVEVETTQAERDAYRLEAINLGGELGAAYLEQSKLEAQLAECRRVLEEAADQAEREKNDALAAQHHRHYAELTAILEAVKLFHYRGGDPYLQKALATLPERAGKLLAVVAASRELYKLMNGWCLFHPAQHAFIEAMAELEKEEQQ